MVMVLLMTVVDTQQITAPVRWLCGGSATPVGQNHHTGVHVALHRCADSVHPVGQNHHTSVAIFLSEKMCPQREESLV